MEGNKAGWSVTRILESGGVKRAVQTERIAEQEERSIVRSSNCIGVEQSGAERSVVERAVNNY